MKLFYNLFIRVYGNLLYCISPFHRKAYLWIKGRKDWEQRLRQQFSSEKEVTWIHCASLGEFEQGRPLIEALRENRPGLKIVLTFFSPSGYEVRKNYPGADFVCYLPLDTQSNAKIFLDIIRPSQVFFIKYEFWLNYLHEIKARGIEAYLVSAVFRKDQLFFKGYGRFMREGLKAYTRIFVQDEASAELLASIDFHNVTVAGDSRFDRVLDIAKQAVSIPLLEQFSGNLPILVAGSTWEQDEDLLCRLEPGNYKLVIAPHEISHQHLDSLLKKFSNHEPVLFSRAAGEDLRGRKVMIIDNIGMLSSVYKYGKVAYIGGGFGKGIHNILEPAVFGMPVLFGPRFDKFREARELIACGAGFNIDSFGELDNKLKLFFNDAALLQLVSAAAQYYVKGKAGATRAILQYCMSKGKAGH